MIMYYAGHFLNTDYLLPCDYTRLGKETGNTPANLRLPSQAFRAKNVQTSVSLLCLT